MGILESIALMVVAFIGPTSVLASNLLYLGTMAALYGGIAYGAMALQGAFVQKPAVPKPEDGSYNLKQNVPPLSIVMGRVKKGGDYTFLEEANGTAYHITCLAGHRINGVLRHYLHDEPVTLSAGNNGWVVAPEHFAKPYRGSGNWVLIQWHAGLDGEVAYSDVVSAFPGVWTNDHRGDGLATVRMSCSTVTQEDYLEIYPNQMPEHSCVLEGALLYDPRLDSTVPGGSGGQRTGNHNSWTFSTNLALMRLRHLCSPWGGKMSYDRMYMPDWINAANVCDQIVVNRIGGVELRYHGGMWFRTNNDQIEVGRYLDEAGEMVVYERADGKIGVHAGQFVEPDITLDQDHIFAIRVDKNKRLSSTVLAVRGRYVNTDNHFVTEDAAIYGDPYGEFDETERTKTFDNPVIQSHNHCQRKQKLTYIRANARKVSITANYSDAKNCAYRRFIRVHYPSRGLVNAIIEITSTVTLDLRNMRVSFSGIVVSSDLYAFNAATEEGSPGNTVTPVVSGGVPMPSGFVASVQTEVVSGGASAALIVGEWSFQALILNYEMEFEPVDGSAAAQSVYSKAGDTDVRTPYLVDGKQYRTRLRTWGGGTKSEWTDYQLLTAVADPTPPGPVTDVSVSEGTGQALFQWTAPNSSNYFACRIYIGTTNVLDDADLAATEYGPPSAIDQRTILGLDDGDYYAWLVAINPSGRPASAVPTGIFAVS